MSRLTSFQNFFARGRREEPRPSRRKSRSGARKGEGSQTFSPMMRVGWNAYWATKTCRVIARQRYGGPRRGGNAFPCCWQRSFAHCTGSQQKAAIANSILCQLLHRNNPQAIQTRESARLSLRRQSDNFGRTFFALTTRPIDDVKYDLESQNIANFYCKLHLSQSSDPARQHGKLWSLPVAVQRLTTHRFGIIMRLPTTYLVTCFVAVLLTASLTPCYGGRRLAPTGNFTPRQNQGSDASSFVSRSLYVLSILHDAF
jgi:hypothetical protein